MPPRKRSISENASELQPPKRVTRSSTKGDAPAATAPIASPKTKFRSSTTQKPVPKAESKSKAAKSTIVNHTEPDVLKKKEDSKAKSQAEPDSSSAPSNHESLSIISDLVKNPIKCHTYPSHSKSTTPTLLFTHGAGGTLSAPAVVNFCTGFSTIAPVTAFQGSINLTSRVEGFTACIKHFQPTQRLILGGRSMGARAAVLATLQTITQSPQTAVDLILASYPLRGPKDIRSQILIDLPARIRVLFVVGDRDAMCGLEMLGGVRGEMRARSQLVVVTGADHGMRGKSVGLEKGWGEETGRLAASWMLGDLLDEVTYVGREG